MSVVSEADRELIRPVLEEMLERANDKSEVLELARTMGIDLTESQAPWTVVSSDGAVPDDSLYSLTTEYLEVPGGRLYRTTIITDRAVSVSTTFVPKE